jgi:heterodisulfide reductase subunit B
MFELKNPVHKLNQARLDAVPSITDKIYYFKGCTERLYPGIDKSFTETCKIMGAKLVTNEGEQSCCTGNYLAFNTAPLATPLAITQRNYNVIREQANTCVTTCNGCFSSFQNCDWYMKKEEWRAHITDVMEQIGRKFIDDVKVFHAAEFYYKNRAKIQQYAKRSFEGVKLAIHYGCHFLHQEDPAVLLDDFVNPSILETLIGDTMEATVADYRERLTCCGAGLNQRIIKDDRTNSLKITLRKMTSIKKAGADAIVVVCPYCLLHLDNAQAELEVEFDESFDIPVLHLSEVIGLLFDLPAEIVRLDAHKVSAHSFLKKIGYLGQNSG